MNTIDIHNLFLKCKSVSIDTRNIKKNAFFVAIKGANFDANSYALEALNKGASFVVIDNPNYYIDKRTIVVENSLITLQNLAAYHRQYLNITVIALTGSNGKTTTKELFQAVLSQKFETKATFGNLNNHIGVPLTLLSFTEKTEIGIVEMGANHQNEIAFLTAIIKPNFGYITNFGKAHLEGFGGVEGVIKGKSELYTYLLKENKIVVVNLDDILQIEKTKEINKITFGINKPGANLNIQNVKAAPFVKVAFNTTQINSNLIGLYNATNIYAAIAIGCYFGVSDSAIKTAIESYIPENNRSQILNKGTNEIILDAYNANPSSMAVAIENFIQLNKPNKHLILGDMFELGEASLEEHKTLVFRLLLEEKCHSYFVGESFYQNRVEKNNCHFFKNFDAFKNFLIQNPIQNSFLLIKGSRGMALEKAVELL